MKKVLITGGTGFAGRHLVNQLLSLQNQQIHVTSYIKQPDSFSHRNVVVHKLDLTDFSATKNLIETVRPDFIYHLASIPVVGASFEKANEILSNNTILQLSLLNAIVETQQKSNNFFPKILIIGSAEEYGVSKEGELPINEEHPLRPINPYAVSKVAQDLLGHAFFISHGLDLVRVRPFNHIGAGQADDFVVSSFAKQIALIEKGKQEAIMVGNLKSTRDFTDVRDMVKAYQILMEKGRAGEVYNVGSGRGVTIASILDKMIAMSNRKINLKIDQKRLRPSDIPEMVADNSKIVGLGWKPSISLDQTLNWVLEDWRNKV